LKPKFFILPVIALVIVASWFGSERRSTSLLEQDSAVLKQRLAARASDSATDGASSKAKSPDQLAKNKAPIDWKKLAAKQGKMRSSDIGDIGDRIRLGQKLSMLSKEELISALDEIATLDMPDASRLALQRMLLGPLCEKDPESALTHYFERMNGEDSSIRWGLANAMKDWAGKNPAAATAWFDQQIAAGKFDGKSLDGKSQAWIQFEGSLITGLISTDPAAAALRLKSLPEDQRADSLRSAGRDVKNGDQLAYANLVRSGLPENAQAEQFAEKASNMAWNEGYTEITGYLDRIKATPTERAVCVEKSVDSKIQQLSQNKKVTREDIDAMRTWATSQAPGTTAVVTGFALARATRADHKMEFSEAAALASKYAEASGNDDVLSSFLAGCEAGPRYEKEAAVLAAKISDVKKREEILNRFK
jgi:hypothetical protein